MAKRHSTKSIPPFPADLDRDAFGYWLSGFTDGEGYFTLTHSRKKNGGWSRFARFGIQLRADDFPILESIRSFLRCGIFVKKQGKLNLNPMMSFNVEGAGDLANIVVPCFDRYPLRAKKLKDFLIWKQGVALLDRIRLRKKSRSWAAKRLVSNLVSKRT